MEPKTELLSLQQIQYFCATLELNSFTTTTDTLRISQPTITKQMHKLEQALGTDLFVRTKRGVVTTKTKHAFTKHTTHNLRTLKNTTNSVNKLTKLRNNTVAIKIFNNPTT